MTNCNVAISTHFAVISFTVSIFREKLLLMQSYTFRTTLYCISNHGFCACTWGYVTGNFIQKTYAVTPSDIITHMFTRWCNIYLLFLLWIFAVGFTYIDCQNVQTIMSHRCKCWHLRYSDTQQIRELSVLHLQDMQLTWEKKSPL